MRNAPVSKPDSLDLIGMVSANPDMFICGPEVLPKGRLDADGLQRQHDTYCPRCRLHGPQELCPFDKLKRCISHGWLPPLPNVDAAHLTSHDSNHASCAAFDEQIDKIVQGYVADGIYHEMTEGEVVAMCGRSPVVSPLGALVKNSDLRLAKRFAGVDITDSESLRRANEALAAQGLNPIKVRPITDMKASGANDAAESPPFVAPSLSTALASVRPGDYLGIDDIKDYFPGFPLAKQCRYLFCVKWRGRLYVSSRLNFGFRLSPYFCLTFSALLREWVVTAVGDAFVMTDDWLLRAGTLPELNAKLDTLEQLGGECGFHFSPHKRKTGQRVLYLGTIIDTVTMTLAIDATQALIMREELQDAASNLKAGRLAQPQHQLAKTGGRLNWYASILQSGRLHNRTWFLYMTHGNTLSPAMRTHLLNDLEWWCAVLESWSRGESASREYPIWSTASLLADPSNIYVVQSDASGVDGFGYFHGTVSDSDPQYVSCAWTTEELASSHQFELLALRKFLMECHQRRTFLLLWVTDSESATWSINKGRCREEAGLTVLRDIYTCADDRRIEIVALWVPREANSRADFLSHYASLLNRPEVSGRLSEIPTL